jgi:hypothetical protein
VQAQRLLTQVVIAARSPGCFASRLNGRQQQRHQDTDNGYDHEKFDEREASRAIANPLGE